jgi:c-di-GMP-binding flagellar brake protein YcgR
MQERRKYPRTKATHIAEVEQKKKLSDIPAITKDISLTGACIFSDTYFEPGRYVKVNIYRDNTPLKETRDAVVAWSKLSKDNFGVVFQIGLNIPEKL